MQYESREALKYAGLLVGVPLGVGFLVSRFVAAPLWSYAEGLDPQVFALRDEQKIEGAHEIHLEELRIRMVRGWVGGVGGQAGGLAGGWVE